MEWTPLSNVEWNGVHGVERSPWSGVESRERSGVRGVEWSPWSGVESIVEWSPWSGGLSRKRRSISNNERHV